MWKRRHALEVQSRRRQAAHVAAAQEAEKASEKDKSPWKIGNEKYPLRPEWVTDILKPFAAGKQSGLQELEEAGLGEVAERMRASKYHSQDAAEAVHKARFGRLIDDESILQGTWATVQQEDLAEESCWALHPGVCKNKDKDVLANMPSFMSLVPKRNDAVLKFEHGGRAAASKAAGMGLQQCSKQSAEVSRVRNLSQQCTPTAAS